MSSYKLAEQAAGIIIITVIIRVYIFKIIYLYKVEIFDCLGGRLMFVGPP